MSPPERQTEVYAHFVTAIQYGAWFMTDYNNKKGLSSLKGLEVYWLSR